MDALVAEIRQKITGPIAVLLGGTTRERDVSLDSGNAVFNALKEAGLPCIAVDTQQDWQAILNDNGVKHSFIALHGVGGEDGTIQGALEYLGITYTGSKLLASALGMDKLRCKHLWRGIALPTADYALLDDSSDFAAILASLGGKVIVKPALEGSSIGMSIATTADALDKAYQFAGGEKAVVMAERWIDGEEYTVAILNGKTLPAIELRTDHSFYDYNAKYIANDTQYICPAPLAQAQADELSALALAAFNSVGCKGWGRVDFMRDQQGRFNLLEVNTVPGMTSHSLVPMAAKAAGLNFNRLVLTILAESLSIG